MAAFLTINHRGLASVIGNLKAAQPKVRAQMRREMGRIVHDIERDVKRNGLTGSKGSHPLFGVTGAAGNALGVRSGRTRNSVVARVLDTPTGVVGVVGSPEKHMKIHEEGGTITGNPYLRIPTREMQTGAGVDRLQGQSARVIAGAFVLRSKLGNLWIALRGRDGNPVLLYLLKRSVFLRARRIFARSLERMRPTIQARLRSAVAGIGRP